MRSFVLSLLAGTTAAQLTCGGLKQIYSANGCCAEKALDAVTGAPGVAMEPPVPGMMPGISKPKITLATDVDYPPYASVNQSNLEIAGFGPEFAAGMMTVCDIDVTVRQTTWSECWTGGDLNMYGQGPHAGSGLENAYYHGCMLYTHTTGVRNRWLEFSHGITANNKPAGILTRLDSSGVPVISPKSDLTGFTIVDVSGWAPTADGIKFVNNSCTGKPYTGFNLVTPPSDGNDPAMAMLMNGEADGMWVYADQAANFQPVAGVAPSWNTTLWEGFGTKYAYISTGLFDHAFNGTTLAIGKKGSGLAAVVNPCIDKFAATKAYYDLCVKYDMVGSCLPNSYFPGGWFGNADTSAPKPYMKATKDQATTSCSDGYCGCNAGGSLTKA